MNTPKGYFLADTNSLVYAYRTGGTELLDIYREMARAEDRQFAITKTVRDEIKKGPLNAELLRYVADKNIRILDNPQTEQRLRTGEITSKNAGEESIVEVAKREHAAGRSTPVLADDRYFASQQKLSEAPGVQPTTSADLLNQARKDKFISESKYRDHLAGYRSQSEFRTGSASYSPRLDTFDPAKATLVERLSEPRVAAGLALKATAGVVLGADVVLTGREAMHLANQGNGTGAQSEILHFAGRAGGGAVGAVAGSALGGAVAGPWGAVGGGILGGAAGVLGGDKLLDAADQQHIHTQRGSDGNSWHYDERPGQGWTRMSADEGPGQAGSPVRALRANAHLADELNYKASNTAVELALSRAPALKDPFRQAPESIGEATRPGIGANEPWTRDPQSQAWRRQAIEPATPMTHGMPVQRTVTASPEQSRQLDAAAQRTIAQNINHSPQAIAQQYQEAYDRNGWKQHGPVPAAVLNAERTQPTQQQASPAALAPPAHSAHPALTPQQIEAAVAARTPPSPLPAGRMSFAEAHQRRDEPEKISSGLLQPVDKLPKADRMHELTLMREIGIVNAKTEQEIGKAQQGPQRKMQPSMEHAQDRAPEQTPVQEQAAPAVQAPMPTPTRGEHAVAPAPTPTPTPGHPASPAPLAATPPLPQPAQPLQSESSVQAAQQLPAAPQPATVVPLRPTSATAQPAAPDTAAVHAAKVAALQEQIAQLTGQRGQDHRTQLNGNDDMRTTQAVPVPRAEPVAPTRPTDPRDSSHADHRDFQKIYAAVAQNGHWDAQQSASIATQVLADFKTNPLGKRLDVVSVEPDKNGKLTVFAGYAPWGEQKGCLSMVTVDPAQAARVPAEQGFDRLAQVSQQRELQEEQQRMQQDQQGMRRA